MINALLQVWKVRPREALNSCLGPHGDKELWKVGPSESELPVPGGMQAELEGTQWGQWGRAGS